VAANLASKLMGELSFEVTPALAFVVPRHRQCHFFCAVICTKTQAQNNLSYLSDRF
jgi:hypothetical protein